MQEFFNAKYNKGEGLSSATIWKIYHIINPALNKAVKESLIYKNPAEDVELPPLDQTLVRPFTAEERKRFFDAALGTEHNGEYILLDDTGMRCCELIALTWDDIDFINEEISINKTLSVIKERKENSDKKYKAIVQKPKTKSSIRKVPLTQRALRMLQERKLTSDSKSNLVFSSRAGTHLDPRNFQRSFHSILEKAGIKSCGCHTLRHLCDTLLYKGHTH